MAVVSSGYSTTSPLTTTNPLVWQFIAVQNPAIQIQGIYVTQPLEQTVVESRGVFRPLGRSKAIVVAGSQYGLDGKYKIIVKGETDWANAYQVVTYQGVLLVRDPLGRQKYIRTTDKSWTESGNISALIREIDINYVEVDAP
jgi:hypothetical protein